MSNTIINFFSNYIEVEVNPEYFIFRKSGKEIVVRTVIYLSTDTRPRVLAVGDEHIPSTPNVRIDLFGSEENSMLIEKGGCLDAYFRHCIRLLNRPSYFIGLRPNVIFLNVSSLNGILGGYQRVVLKSIASNAGVLKSNFKN